MPEKRLFTPSGSIGMVGFVHVFAFSARVPWMPDSVDMLEVGMPWPFDGAISHPPSTRAVPRRRTRSEREK